MACVHTAQSSNAYGQWTVGTSASELFNFKSPNRSNLVPFHQFLLKKDLLLNTDYTIFEITLIRKMEFLRCKLISILQCQNINPLHFSLTYASFKLKVNWPHINKIIDRHLV